jgi:GTP-binding protein Era
MMPVEGFRAGFVAVVGLTNVGKSTLVNALVGRRLSIVTPKAQTTRRRLLGIYSDEDRQAVFVDTPGLLEPRYLLQEAMKMEAEAALEDADVVTYVVDAGFEPSLKAGRRFRVPGPRPAILCLNKMDRVDPEDRAALEASFRGEAWDEVVPTIATEGEGVERLREAILSRLPASPPYYPVDDLSSAPLRFFAEEFVREACFEELEEEVPYSVAVQVEEFREEEEPLFISATLFVERSSQKGIVIGRGGRMIRRIGTSAREKIEAFMDRRVYLDLRVKVLKKWRKRADELAGLGFHILKRG